MNTNYSINTLNCLHLDVFGKIFYNVRCGHPYAFRFRQTTSSKVHSIVVRLTGTLSVSSFQNGCFCVALAMSPLSIWFNLILVVLCLICCSCYTIYGHFICGHNDALQFLFTNPDCFWSKESRQFNNNKTIALLSMTQCILCVCVSIWLKLNFCCLHETKFQCQ